VGARQPVPALTRAERFGVKNRTTPASPFDADQLCECAGWLISACGSDDKLRVSLRPPTTNAMGPFRNCSKRKAPAAFTLALGTMKIGPEELLPCSIPLIPSVPLNPVSCAP